MHAELFIVHSLKTCSYICICIYTHAHVHRYIYIYYYIDRLSYYLLQFLCFINLVSSPSVPASASTSL